MSNEKLEQILQKQQTQMAGPDVDQREDDIIQLVGFVVGDEEYAIPILNIQEIIIKPIEYTRVPSVPDYVLGVFNMRGNVMPLIDLAQRFHLGSSKMTPQTRYIVLRGETNGTGVGGNAGFVIDRLTEAIKIHRNRIDPPPETLVKDKGMIYGIGKRDENILTILKVEALLKREF
ncbi:purine-binding chemotaxis protein CheW [Campylobacter jejuni]|nr:chemotaxis protein CheW [Campylobacter jejuni]ECL2307187.1 purine-binding chemotaxis protein CheW [Campylobacter jejuni]ECM6524426.1 purine-binding chemotaxis protein CheW [Campylobacter jejuni]ECM6525127.1 purine-binding chemotaxis protein CheW [Campylobacter jejuni]EDP5706371.1 purine-binding chemotaxis protein CheW [Campylobacter jejuni]EHG2411474.1 purine-binding chemotaxis protein CheW [Campylobacter jejuni]